MDIFFLSQVHKKISIGLIVRRAGRSEKLLLELGVLANATIAVEHYHRNVLLGKCPQDSECLKISTCYYNSDFPLHLGSLLTMPQRVQLVCCRQHLFLLRPLSF